MNFVCPKCRLALSLSGGALRCENNHTYDVARQGYVNLLLSGGGIHGDNREMVEARRDFLDTGAYLLLAEKLVKLAKRHFCGTRILDIGCGEGYYTDHILRALSNEQVELSAFDISRDAVKLAAKRNKSVSLAVASAYDMPLSDGSVDMAFNMFSPLCEKEVWRALRDGGIFIMAVPGEEHLFGLKSVAYRDPYKKELLDPELTGFSLLESERVRYTLTLDSKEKIRALFMMTPYAYRTSEEGRERVFSLDSLVTEVDFVVFVYKKQPL